MADGQNRGGSAGSGSGRRQGAPTVFDDLLPPPKVSLRELPGLLRVALGIVWAAGRRELAFMVALQLPIGGATAVGVLASKAVLGGVFAAHASDGGFGAFLPSVLLLAAATIAVVVLSAVETSQREVLQELTARFAQERILDVACAAELESFERPDFHDRLARAQASWRLGPVTVVYGLTHLLRSLAAAIGVALALLALEPLLVPLALVAIVPAWVDSRRRAEAYVHFSFRMTPRDRERLYLSQILTSRDSAPEVRAFGLAAFLRGRHDQLWEQRLRELRSVSARALRFSLVAGLASGVALGGALALLVALALGGQLSLADAGAGAGATLLLSRQLNMAGFGAGELYRAALFLEDLRTFLDLLPQSSPPPGGGDAVGEPRALAAEAVSFTYPSGSRPALREVSLRVDPGEVVALVGENGCGKTTLAKVLSGLYGVDSGRVVWGDEPVNDERRPQLRDSVAVIFQDFVKYRLSARDNIALGRHEHYENLDRVQRAAARSGADEAIDPLPDRYDTQLGPEFHGGTELSVGQWQRIALARAFFRDAPLLILDEPTAALDARAEHELFESLRTLLAGRSVLLISHRFSSVRSANRIYVMKAGAIVEHGTHDELMATQGLYAELFTLQAASYTNDLGALHPPVDHTYSPSEKDPS